MAGPPTWRCDAAGQNFIYLRQLEAQNGVAAALTPVGRHRPRFLVVEDMAELADLLVQCLEALEIEVEVAATGEAALLLLSRGSFDVALVDIELPDTTGFEVMAIARESGWLRNTHIVFCTGSRSEEYRQRAARFSGSSFLWKPFTLQDLVKCIEGVPSAPAQAEIRVHKRNTLERTVGLGVGGASCSQSLDGCSKAALLNPAVEGTVL